LGLAVEGPTLTESASSTGKRVQLPDYFGGVMGEATHSQEGDERLGLAMTSPVVKGLAQQPAQG
jgi:hypothetical protein